MTTRDVFDSKILPILIEVLPFNRLHYETCVIPYRIGLDAKGYILYLVDRGLFDSVKIAWNYLSVEMRTLQLLTSGCRTPTPELVTSLLDLGVEMCDRNIINLLFISSTNAIKIDLVDKLLEVQPNRTARLLAWSHILYHNNLELLQHVMETTDNIGPVICQRALTGNYRNYHFKITDEVLAYILKRGWVDCEIYKTSWLQSISKIAQYVRCTEDILIPEYIFECLDQCRSESPHEFVALLTYAQKRDTLMLIKSPSHSDRPIIRIVSALSRFKIRLQDALCMPLRVPIKSFKLLVKSLRWTPKQISRAYAYYLELRDNGAPDRAINERLLLLDLMR